MIEHLVKLHGQIELRLTILNRELGARIEHQLQRGGIDPVALRHLHGIRAGHHPGTNRSFKQRRSRRRNCWRLEPHRPSRSVQATMFTARDRIEQLTVLIEDFNFQVAENMAALLVIGDESIRWTAETGEAFIAFRPAAVGIEVLDGRRSFEDGGILLHQVRLELAKRRNVVNDPDAPSMCSQHQIGLTGLNGDIADCRGREIAALVLRPALAAVGRDPQAKFRSQEKQIWIDGVLFDHVGVSADAAWLHGKRGPGLAIISCFISVRFHVAESVAIKRCVGSTLVEAAGFNG